jgi:hypothetical protein
MNSGETVTLVMTLVGLAIYAFNCVLSNSAKAKRPAKRRSTPAPSRDPAQDDAATSFLHDLESSAPTESDR